MDLDGFLAAGAFGSGAFSVSGSNSFASFASLSPFFLVPRFFFNGSKLATSTTSVGASSATSCKTTLSRAGAAETGMSFIFCSLRPFNLGTGASSMMLTNFAAVKVNGFGAASVIIPPRVALIRANMSSRLTSFRLALSTI
ncbi:MAG: hypothetical protein EBV30_09820 [Actinobacteria bacterium]|nr:hypothetical protein [Actinomycetota bacterium]